jgi:ubiquinone/menaquinone biosynthesis C-methylase UbiE
MKRYDETADKYDARYEEEQYRKYQSVLGLIRFDSDDVVLDNGCGTGLFMKEVSMQAKMVIGVDLSINMLKKAHERLKEVDKAHIVHCDSDNLPFRKDVFSKVAAFTLIQNMPNPCITIFEAKKASSERSIFILTFLKRKFNLDEIRKLLIKAHLLLVNTLDENDLKDYIIIFKNSM